MIGSSDGQTYEDRIDYLTGNSVENKPEKGAPITMGGQKEAMYKRPQAVPPLPILPPLGYDSPDLVPEQSPNQEILKGIRRLPPGKPSPGVNPNAENRDMLLIRHGATDYNLGSGGEKDKEYIRGHIDVPLNEEGRQQAAETADKLKDKIQPGSLIVSSDLVRARETAETIAKATGAKLMLDPGLRPWDLGDFQGRPAADCHKAIQGYCMDKPDTPVPNGESFNQFKQRASDAMINAAQMGAAAIVTHHRLDRLDAASDEKGNVDFNTFLSKGDDTGSFRPIKLAMMDDPNRKNVIDFPVGGKGESPGGGSKGPAQVVPKERFIGESARREAVRVQQKIWDEEDKAFYEKHVKPFEEGLVASEQRLNQMVVDKHLQHFENLATDWARGNISNDYLRQAIRDRGWKIESKELLGKLKAAPIRIYDPQGKEHEIWP